MKKAFTLIELLVVIAIIAILAAILFPVFAQAKVAAKKTADLSNMKQTGTANAIYQSDSDDLFPLQSGQDLGGNWGYNYNKYVPSDWSAAPSNANRPYYSQSFFMNTIQPYMKNTQMLSGPGLSSDIYNSTEPLAAGKSKGTTSYAFNGLLSSFSSTAVVSSSKLPFMTSLNGNIAGQGWGFANPALTCPTANASCTYIPCGGTGNGSGSAVYTTHSGGSYWTYGHGQNWDFADTHAKFHPMGGTLAPNNTDWRTDPMTQYDATGHAGYYWYDGCHPWLFRPDYDFSL